MIGGVERVAGFPVAQSRENAFHQWVFDGFLHDQSGTRRTILAHIPERGVDDMLGHEVEVFGIVQNNRRVLAAAFENDLLEIAVGRIAQKPPSGFCRTGKGNHVNIHVHTERLANRRTITR